MFSSNDNKDYYYIITTVVYIEKRRRKWDVAFVVTTRRCLCSTLHTIIVCLGSCSIHYYSSNSVSLLTVNRASFSIHTESYFG